MISVKGLSVKIGSFSLKDISLDIPEGGYFMVVGPTGAGKTIILESIAGLQRFRSGEIWISGKDVTSLPPEQRQIGYVPQDYALFPFLNVRDNITFGLRRTGNNKQQNKERMESLAHILGIHHLLERSVRKLSGGEKQRVAIARALLMNPKYLFADEPTGNLDSVNGDRIMALFQKINVEKRTTVIYVTHDLDYANLASRKIELIDGIIKS